MPARHRGACVMSITNRPDNKIGKLETRQGCHMTQNTTLTAHAESISLPGDDSSAPAFLINLR
jgi:hypothetical protein